MEEGTDDEPEVEPGPEQRGPVHRDGVERVRPVEQVRAVRAGVDVPAFPGRGLGVPDDRLGGDQHLEPGVVGTPAEVEVVAEQRDRPVEALELVPHVAADEHAGRADGEHRAYLVVLALVVLAALEAGPAPAVAGHGDAHLEQLPPVVPAVDLRSDDGDLLVRMLLGVLLGGQQQLAEAVGGRGAVVVQQPDPLDRRGGLVAELVVADRLRVLQSEGDGRAVAGRALALEHRLGTERGTQLVDRAVAGAGVHGDDALGRALLAEQRLEHGGQPALPVVGDEDGGDDMTAQRFMRVCGVRAGARRRCEL